MLSSGVLTQFRDHADEIHVNPLSFAEVYDLYENKELAFERYTAYGGMPYIYSLQTDEEKRQYLKGLFQETYIKDILERNNIQNKKEILELLLILHLPLLARSLIRANFQEDFCRRSK